MFNNDNRMSIDLIHKYEKKKYIIFSINNSLDSKTSCFQIIYHKIIIVFYFNYFLITPSVIINNIFIIITKKKRSSKLFQ